MKDAPQQDFATPDKQEARSFLRERFLRALAHVSDKECTLHLYDKSNVNAKFGGIDVDMFKLYVKDLQTPMFQHPHAIVRTSDILSIDVPKASYQKLLAPHKEGQNGNEPMES
ncbi:gem-associated protein 7-like isoform X1 [Homalodisca vitripennis]|uniref:gem-associated protein 7-like isoform X1 n=1 Tax=Homalodisca vitripennis TaxID=197043 RepID=UPI001EEC4022|nr:gem-associated protein 7-like isoform X1 [Homalodisca vitripennis]